MWLLSLPWFVFFFITPTASILLCPKNLKLFVFLYMHILLVPCIYNDVSVRNFISIPLTLMSTSHILILCFCFIFLTSLYSLIEIMILIWCFKKQHLYIQVFQLYIVHLLHIILHIVFSENQSLYLLWLVVYRCSGFLNILLFC